MCVGVRVFKEKAAVPAPSPRDEPLSDSESEADSDAPEAEGVNEGDDGEAVGFSQESQVIAEMDRLSLKPRPTMVESDSSDDEEVPPLAAPSDGDESESELGTTLPLHSESDSESKLPIQDEDQCDEMPCAHVVEHSDQSDDEPSDQNEMDQVPSDSDGENSREAENEAPPSPEIQEITPEERKYAGRDELFQSPMAGNSGPRQEVITELCVGLMQFLHKNEPQILEPPSFGWGSD